MEQTRLQTVYAQAGRLFRTRGYADTKMAEIAKRSGIAVGTMYSTFTGKEAVYSFVIEAALDKDYFDREISLPIEPAPVSRLLTALRKVIGQGREILNIANQEGGICKDFMGMAEEIFDFFADYVLALDTLQNNPGILEELRRDYWPEKMAFFQELEKRLRLYRERGQILDMEYDYPHTVFFVNMLTWWAVNYEIESHGSFISKTAAKKTCMGMIRRIYLP